VCCIWSYGHTNWEGYAYVYAMENRIRIDDARILLCRYMYIHGKEIGIRIYIGVFGIESCDYLYVDT